MTPDRSQQIEALFLAARALPQEAARKAYLTAACAGDDELRAAVERLLAQAEGTATLLKDTVLEASAPPDFAAPSSDLDPLLGARLGAYRILSELGRGGMGAVYLADRVDGAFKQRVAIKLVKRGMDTNFILRRFRQERQILATLNHPFVARLLDGGTTDDGLPYFVMEFIEGQSLYQFSDAHRLSIVERLRLFLPVCEAVEYAHQNQIIHRDLKPSNVLVNTDNVPKLLDFGIAKVLNPELASDTLDPTATHMRLMTPDYASPEQIKGEAITAASDIYSLGVLLYELLTGHRPYRFRHRAPHEISRAVCEDEPETPSASLAHNNFAPTGSGETLTTDAVLAARGATLISLRRTLTGELDRVMLKALRKNPVERYASVAALAQDITNYLEKRPVQAEAFAAATKTPPRIAATPTQPELAVRLASNTGGGKSLAVLPFKLLNPKLDEASGDFLGIGLADALITRLSMVRRFVVRPTSSVLRFGDATDSLQAGRELGVDFVLEGNLRRTAERIRVTIQLLCVSTQAATWAGSFDEKNTEVLELEDSISERVATALIPHLTGAEQEQLAKRGTQHAAAYEAYLRGRYYWNQFTPESLPKALAAFESAIALDPHYALAYVGLADFYVWANIYGLIPASALAQSEAAARRAIELDDQLGEAYASLGLIMTNHRRWAVAEHLIQQAIQLSPHYVHGHEWYAALLIGTGRTAEGLAEINLAERLDPFSLRTENLTAWTLYQSHRFAAALERGHRLVDMDKHHPQGYSQIALNLLALGQPADALPYFQQFDDLMPNSALAKYQLCFGYAAAGRTAEARTVLAAIKTLATHSYVKPYFLAMAHTALDERDQAFAHFNQAFAEADSWMLWFGTEPLLASLHEDERYLALRQRMKMPPC